MLHTYTHNKPCSSSSIKPSVGINNELLHDGLYLTNFKMLLRNHTNLIMIPKYIQFFGI